MPVYKYKTFEEAERHLKELLPKSPLQRFIHLEPIMHVLRPKHKFQRGIFKFKTIEEANRHRQMLEQDGSAD